MKKKLLITMGCSLTEGVGCYGDMTKEKWNQDMYEDFLDRFHQYAWPTHLVKKMGYDKLINLGLGASSTSGQLKQFSEKYLHKDLSEYDVLIIWLLTDSSRFSFYLDYQIHNYLCTFVDDSESTLSKSYIHEMNDINADTLLEQVFYIKMMEQICENKGYKLLLVNSSSDEHKRLVDFYESDNYLTIDNPHTIFNNDAEGDEYLSPIGCHHPNESGYEIVSNKIFDLIQKNYSSLINDIKPIECEMIWDGSVIDYTDKFKIDFE